MTSTGHVIGGLALASIVCDVVVRSPVLLFQPITDMCVFATFMTPYALIALLLFLLGTLLPDCDIDTSYIGRYVHVAVEHRTWTHSIWVPIILTGIFYVWQNWAWSLWLVFGYVIHLILDSWSKMGICWFYPYPGFRQYPNGARVKKGKIHKVFSWYHAGTYEETRVVVILVILAVVSRILCNVVFL